MKKRINLQFILCVLLLVFSLCSLTLLGGCSIPCTIGGEHDWKLETDFSFFGGEPAHKDPTCTEEGYSKYKCTYCSEKKTEIIPPTGHRIVVDKARVEPTCKTVGEEEISHCGVCNVRIGIGRKIDIIPHSPKKVSPDIPPTCISTGISRESYCSMCHEKMEDEKILPMTEHNKKIITEAVQPTCTNGGYTAEIHCKDCHCVIETRRPVNALGHSFTRLISTTATCKKGGDAVYGCERCVATENRHVGARGHHDGDNDCFCDECGYPCASTVTEISGINDLAAIARNLSGVYVLTNDITVNEEWLAIGTKNEPFTGILYGDGHTIRGLKQINKNIGGLFGYNSGTIANLTIDGFEIGMNRNINGQQDITETYVTGALCAENRGKIKNCKITGRNTVQGISWFGAAATNCGVKPVSFTSTSGGFCAANRGTVESCEILGSITFNYSHTTVFVFNKKGFHLLVDDDCGKGTGNFTFGGIVAINTGTIANCTVFGAITGNVDISADRGDSTPDCGLAYAYGTIKIGSAVGENLSGGSMTNCSAKKAVYSENVQSSWRSSSYCGEVIVFNEVVDTTYNGVVGANGGNIRGFVPIY